MCVYVYDFFSRFSTDVRKFVIIIIIMSNSPYVMIILYMPGKDFKGLCCKCCINFPIPYDILHKAQ